MMTLRIAARLTVWGYAACYPWRFLGLVVLAAAVALRFADAIEGPPLEVITIGELQELQDPEPPRSYTPWPPVPPVIQ
jgi:hypothetical protein